jgi:hypothetical protein
MRFWTVEEARAYLPRVRELLGQVEAALGELEDSGVILRQLANGSAAQPAERAPTALVDFPSVGDDGDVVFLCWKTDEPDIEWCHAPEAGFAGRRPIGGPTS